MLDKHSADLPFRIKNMEGVVKLLQREKELLEVRTKENKYGDELLKIADQKKVIELEQEINSKTEFLNQLRAKVKEDEKEMKLKMAEAKNGFPKLSDEATAFIDQDEAENNGSFSRVGNRINYFLNEMIILNNDKDEHGMCFYYHALKKELSQAIERKKQLKAAQEASPLKVNAE